PLAHQRLPRALSRALTTEGIAASRRLRAGAASVTFARASSAAATGISMSEAVSVGEVMVELQREPDGRFALAFGGDTFNTAGYLARAGIATSYGTALGDDRFSDAILALCERENVGAGVILRAQGRVPGLYLIETDGKGERSFTYWRDTSPARDAF